MHSFSGHRPSRDDVRLIKLVLLRGLIAVLSRVCCNVLLMFRLHPTHLFVDPAPASEESPDPFGRHGNIRYATTLRDMARLNQPNVIGRRQAKASIHGGVGRGISPRPQPQTGRASFQASGFPDESKHMIPSQS